MEKEKIYNLASHIAQLIISESNTKEESQEIMDAVNKLLSGEEGIITETIPAIKADKRLKLKVKRALRVKIPYAEIEAMMRREEAAASPSPRIPSSVFTRIITA